MNEKQNIPVMRDTSCAGCGLPIEFNTIDGRQPVGDPSVPYSALWHYKCYLAAPDPQRTTAKFAIVPTPPKFAALTTPTHADLDKWAAENPSTHNPAAVDRARMIRWLEGKIAGWEKLEAAAESRRFRRQAAWQLLHARAILAVLRGLA